MELQGRVIDNTIIVQLRVQGLRNKCAESYDLGGPFLQRIIQPCIVGLSLAKRASQF